MKIRNIIGAGVIAGATFIGTATTAIADPPDCTAADLANVMSGVNAGTASYLFSHPDVNAFFTGLNSSARSVVYTIELAAIGIASKTNCSSFTAFAFSGFTVVPFAST